MVDSPFLSGFVVAELRVAAIAAEVYVLCSGCVLLLVDSCFVVVNSGVRVTGRNGKSQQEH